MEMSMNKLTTVNELTKKTMCVMLSYDNNPQEYGVTKQTYSYHPDIRIPKEAREETKPSDILEQVPS